MNNLSTSYAAKKGRFSALKQFPSRAVIAVGVCVAIGFLWLLIIQPLQKNLEQRLQRYPMQLMSIQDLNQTLVRYKDKDVRIASLSENEFSRLEQKLFSQGIKYTLRRIENISPTQVELKIDEIEFSRWLDLVADFRQTYGLYVVGVSIKKNEGVGVVQLSATLAQTR
jgi:type II secretory pathway component PulM